MPEITFSSERVYDGYLAVNSCGKQWLTDRDYDTVRKNGRIDYSIHYVVKGMGYFETNGDTVQIPEGSLILYFPGIRHHYSFKKSDSSVMMWSHFSGYSCDILKKYCLSPAVMIRIQDRKQFESAFEKMIISHYKKTEFSDITSEGYMTVLLSLIMQSLIPNNIPCIKTDNENLEKAVNYMHENYNQTIDIGLYAKMCCVTKDHFIRIFKARFGTTPYHYQMEIRIDRAMEMLETTPITVTSCAEAMGFCDIAHFSKIFKKFTGHPPSYYK